MRKPYKWLLTAAGTGYLDNVNRKSAGSDNMHTKEFRELANVLTEPLTIIFEKSWRTEERSENFKKANTSF